MPAHSKKSSRRHRRHPFRSVRKSHKKPTLKHNKWRIVSHYTPASKKPVSQRNIRRSIAHMIPYNMNIGNEEVRNMAMGNVSQRRARLSRTARNVHQREREEAAAQRAAEQGQRAQRRNQRAAHESSMAELNAMMGKMGI